MSSRVLNRPTSSIDPSGSFIELPPSSFAGLSGSVGFGETSGSQTEAFEPQGPGGDELAQNSGCRTKQCHEDGYGGGGGGGATFPRRDPNSDYVPTPRSSRLEEQPERPHGWRPLEGQRGRKEIGSLNGARTLKAFLDVNTVAERLPEGRGDQTPMRLIMRSRIRAVGRRPTTTSVHRVAPATE